jgi:Flp pilus assembly protein TadG
VTLPLLIVLLLGVIDFGRAYYLSMEIKNAAYSGALFGVQNGTDTTGMQNAATAEAGDAVNLSGWTATATYGCECSDGSGTASATCATTPSCTTGASVVNYVQVSTSATYKTLFPWPGIPSSITLNGLSRLRAGIG